MAAHGSHGGVWSEGRGETGEWYHNYDGYNMKDHVYRSPRRMLPYEGRVIMYEDDNPGPAEVSRQRYDRDDRHLGSENCDRTWNNDKGRYSDNGDANKAWPEWGLSEQLSPRRPTYQPSFHQNGATPRRAPLWERDRFDDQRRQTDVDTPRVSKSDSPRPNGLQSPRRDKAESPRRMGDNSYRRGVDDDVKGMDDRPRRDAYESFTQNKNRRVSMTDNELMAGVDFSRRHTYPSPRQEEGLDRSLDPRMVNAKALVKEERNQVGGAFLFVRFPLARGENVSGVAKACILAKTADLGGRFAGIARKVFNFGYPASPDEGCAVFQFPSLKNAEVFFHRDQRFRQPDFPPPQGHAEIFALGLTTDPNQIYNYDTFLLSEIFLNVNTLLGDYITKFKEPFSALLSHKYRALPFAAFSVDHNDRKSLRRHYFAPKSIVTLHLFRSISHLEEVMADERYTYLRAIHNSIAQEQCSIFSIDREACP